MGQEPEATAGPEPAAEPSEPKEQPKAESKTFDEAYVKKLRDEAAKYRTEAQEAKARAEQYEERDKSELEKLTGKLTKTEQRAAEAETRLLRYEVAADKGLDPKVAAVLSGSTREEIEQAADIVLEQVKAKTSTPEFDGGVREPAPTPKAPEEAHNEFLMQLIGGKST